MNHEEAPSQKSIGAFKHNRKLPSFVFSVFVDPSTNWGFRPGSTRVVVDGVPVVSADYRTLVLP